MSRLFSSGGQSIGASASVHLLNIQCWFPLGLINLISLLSKGLPRVFSSTTIWKHQFFSVQPSFMFHSHICTWLPEKPQLWLYRPLSAKWCLWFLIHSLWLWNPMNCSPPGSSVHGDSPGKNTGVGCRALLRIFPTQGLNPGLPHWRWILCHLSHQGNPRILEWVAYPFSRRTSWPRNQTRILLHCRRILYRRILYQLNYQGSLTIQTVVGEVMSLIFNSPLRFVIAFLPKSKRLFNFMTAVTIHSDFEVQEKKVCHCFPNCHEVMGPDAMTFVFVMLSFKPAVSLSSLTLIKRLFSASSLSAIRVVSSSYLRLLIFLLTILIPACASSSLAFHMMYSA